MRKDADTLSPGRINRLKSCSDPLTCAAGDTLGTMIGRFALKINSSVLVLVEDALHAQLQAGDARQRGVIEVGVARLLL